MLIHNPFICKKNGKTSINFSTKGCLNIVALNEKAFEDCFES